MTDELWGKLVAHVENRLKEVPSFVIGYDIFASRLNLSPDDWLDILRRLEAAPDRRWEIKVEARGSQRVLVVQKKSPGLEQ
jgi:hypothetical protein